MFSILKDELIQTFAVFSVIWSFLYAYIYLWLPLLLGAIFTKVWLDYLRADFIFSQEYFLIEIKIPREIMKTPLAMETFLHALWQKPASTYIETFWLGKIQPWFSLELVSIGGHVKFYIWGQKKFKNIVEAQLYAQYPEVEVYEAEDYTDAVVHDLSRFFMWGTYFKLTEKDVYPIKTYVDYGLDNDNQEEETKVDPLTAVLEYLGSLKQGEQVWIQILIQGHQSRSIMQGHLFPTKDWKKEALQEIANIRAGAAFGQTGFPLMTKGQQDKISAIERSIGKYAFDTIFRAFYICPAGPPDPGAIPGLIGSVKQYSSNVLNGFKLAWFVDFDYPWMDFKRIRRTGMEKRMLRAYKLRSGFQLPYKNFHCKPFILSTEEVATIFHFPGSVAKTPTLSRIDSRRSEAPPNLPV
ncbi:MAG: hypothetical protein A3C06_03745 [Candidatus Taylorbacteria bacterium RIFCSPHIGHO2_02_FULL_46_13]|uniref:DUF8128 domain-containing protein n=1 Tax=Candidatus Taylorbacteria bacterium RIFCSPHIGHO2_02_FULL_46_13 TaxID=1802312 RepID=A0A1G2MTJ2_9BACT|nr:MAG: hypothetical protein A3C06_03745 [Candidatus Taylorbacteria bacterium RIFCSPHIGHO2_02_FULL_46_13]